MSKFEKYNPIIGLFQVVEKIQAERLVEDGRGQQRFEKFRVRHPDLISKKFLTSSLSWIVKEGWGVIATLVIFFCIGLFLRLWNLDVIAPYADEYNHMIEAVSMLSGFPWKFEYQRGFWLVTFPVYLVFEVFGVNLSFARIPGALLNLFAIVPLYALVRRVDKRVALVAVSLYATSPWIVSVARNIREYAIFPLLYLSIGYLFLRWLDGIPKKIRLDQHWKELLSMRNLRYYVLFSLPLFYLQFVDVLSTMESIGAIYVVFGVLFIMRFDHKSRMNWAFVSVGFVGISIMLFLVRDYLYGISITPELSTYWFKRLFYPARQQWYFELWIPLVGLLLGVFSIALVKWRSIPLYAVVGIFLLYFYGYSFHFSHYERPRYGFVMEPWYVIIFAAALFVTYKIITSIFHDHIFSKILVTGLMVGLFINPARILLPTTETSTIHNITREIHYDMDNIVAFVESQREDDEVLMGNMAKNYWKVFLQESFSDFIHFDSHDPNRKIFLEDTIKENESGWFIIDKRRIKKTVPKDDFKVGEIHVQYVGRLDEHFIYHWGEKQISPLH